MLIKKRDIWAQMFIGHNNKETFLFLRKKNQIEEAESNDCTVGFQYVERPEESQFPLLEHKER